MAPVYAELVQLEKKLADKEVEVKAVSRRHARAVKRAAEAKAEYEKCGRPAQPGKAAKQEADVKRYQEKKKRLRQERKDREGELMELVRELREEISCLGERPGCLPQCSLGAEAPPVSSPSMDLSVYLYLRSLMARAICAQCVMPSQAAAPVPCPMLLAISVRRAACRLLSEYLCCGDNLQIFPA